ncbi:MAG: phage holin family protein [Erythrobacter sp.]|uniref:phage holin family protein n=1 Tax=Erythrobacter sp. TaxID=1042 RepID=UPI0025D1F014|nr:phage holin family protein [Erythrobacter sp.]MCM0001227.1 phage holin family protein [Erythrobacter sp.]
MADIDPGLARPQEGAPAEPAGSAPGAPDTTLSALRDDVTALVEDARNYAEAELAFQKTRAALAGKHGARALGLLVLALVLLNLALIALAVGAVIALAPLVTIWGAIAIVVGVLLLGTGLLVAGAMREGRMIGAMFGGGEAS